MSQTERLHIYNIKGADGSLYIFINSQGFGDTNGVTKDESIKIAFEDCFKKVIDHVNVVCFVIKSNITRLDVNQ